MTKHKLVKANSSLPVGVADASWLSNQHHHPHKQHEWVFGVEFGDYYEMPSHWPRSSCSEEIKLLIYKVRTTTL